MSMKCLYRADSAEEVRAMWVGESRPIPEGWTLTRDDALAQLALRAPKPTEAETPKRRRGRPPKVKE